MFLYKLFIEKVKKLLKLIEKIVYYSTFNDILIMIGGFTSLVTDTIGIKTATRNNKTGCISVVTRAIIVV